MLWSKYLCPLQIHGLKYNPKCNEIKKWVDKEGGLQEWMNFHMKEAREGFFVLSTMWGCDEKMPIVKQGESQTQYLLEPRFWIAYLQTHEQ